MPLVNEGVIINFSPVFKRLEDGVYLGSGLLKNILKYFRWSILYGNETVCSRNYSFKKLFLSSYLENAMKSTMKCKVINNEVNAMKNNWANKANLLIIKF